MARNMDAFSGVITDTFVKRGAPTCITVRITGNGQLWPGDKLHIYNGEHLRGSFKVKEYAFQLERANITKPSLVQLYSDDMIAHQAQPGEEIRSVE